MSFITATAGARRSKPRTAFVYLLVVLISLTTVLPFALMISTSLTASAGTAITYPPKLIPDHPSLVNFVYVLTQFRDGLFSRWFLNSTICTVAIVAGGLVLNTFAAYVFARKEFRGKAAMFFLVLSTLFIPAAVRLIPGVQIARALGIYDTLAAVILPAFVTPMGIFLMRQFIAALPGEILEAAKLDGASELRVFFQIVLPMCRPGLAALAIVTATSAWNDFIWPVVVLPSEQNHTLPVGFANLATQYHVDYGSVMAGAVLASIPLVVLFVLMQRHFISGITISAN